MLLIENTIATSLDGLANALHVNGLELAASYPHAVGRLGPPPLFALNWYLRCLLRCGDGLHCRDSNRP